MKKERVISRGAALLIGAVGLYILWVVWYPTIANFLFKSVLNILFLFVFLIPVTCVAVYFLYTAVILWRGLSSKGICKLSVSLSIIFAILIISVPEFIRPAAIEESLWRTASVPFIMILAGGFYLFLKRSLFRWLSIPEEVDCEAHQRAAKLYFGFLAFFIWSAIGQTVELLPKDPNYEHIPKNTLLQGLIVFGSIPLAVWFYKIAIKLYLKKPSVEMSAKDHAQQSMDLM